ncbi:hypothetical protein diail_2471 [Diaporthe ilicicola]|nr:hypothetical protein diail_2471 [Diaporthe ilicicola]
MAPDQLVRIYRSCLFQIVVVGLVAFCEPGIWTALNNLGAASCGIGASLFWASEAAIAVGWPKETVQETVRGRYVAIWMCIRQLGPPVGGAISLALNINTNHAGNVTYTTYQGLVAISALGAPFALLLSQPQEVIRQDGTKIPYMKKTTLGFEARAIWKQLRNREMLMLIPVFQTYSTVRSRALASFLTAILGAAGDLVTGLVLDWNRFSRSARSKGVYIFVLVSVTGAWTWNAVIESELSRAEDPPIFDLGGGPWFNSAFAVYLLFKFFYEVLQTYIYWLMAEIKGGQNDGDIARTTGILRSWESIGSVVAYAVGATSVSNMKQMVLGFALWGFTVPCTLLAIFYYGQQEGGADDSDEVESEVQQETDVGSLEAQRIAVETPKSKAI